MYPHNYPAHFLPRLCFLLLVVLLFVPITGYGQTVEKQDESACGLVRSDLVFLYIEVEDKNGRSLADLSVKQFVVYEDGVKQFLDLMEKLEVFEAGKNRVRYRLGYYSTNDKLDGAFRVIQVQALTENDDKVKGIYWPIGYFAKKP
jgi:hypothetical protein